MKNPHQKRTGLENGMPRTSKNKIVLRVIPSDPIVPPVPLEIDTVPLQYLVSMSDEGLQDFELARLAAAANFDKEIGMIQRQRDREKLAADLARWFRLHRSEMLDSILAGYKRVGISEQERVRTKPKGVPLAKNKAFLPVPTTDDGTRRLVADVTERLIAMEKELNRLIEAKGDDIGRTA